MTIKEKRLSAIQYELSNTSNQGARGRAFELMCAREKSHKIAVAKQGKTDVSVRVVVNGKEAAHLFAVPFRVDITDYVKQGANTLEIEVANLPANRIAQMDRDGVKWRKCKEINVVDLNYKKGLYDQWETVPSGLNSDVRLIPCTLE